MFLESIMIRPDLYTVQVLCDIYGHDAEIVCDIIILYKQAKLYTKPSQAWWAKRIIFSLSSVGAEWDNRNSKNVKP